MTKASQVWKVLVDQIVCRSNFFVDALYQHRFLTKKLYTVVSGFRPNSYSSPRFKTKKPLLNARKYFQYDNFWIKCEIYFNT